MYKLSILVYVDKPTEPIVEQRKRLRFDVSKDMALFMLEQCLTICMTDFYRATACNATHGISKAFLSVYLLVKRVDCDNAKGTCAHILISHERSLIQVFSQEE